MYRYDIEYDDGDNLYPYINGYDLKREDLKETFSSMPSRFQKLVKSGYMFKLAKMIGYDFINAFVDTKKENVKYTQTLTLPANLINNELFMNIHRNEDRYNRFAKIIYSAFSYGGEEYFNDCIEPEEDWYAANQHPDIIQNRKSAVDFLNSSEHEVKVYVVERPKYANFTIYLVIQDGSMIGVDTFDDYTYEFLIAFEFGFFDGDLKYIDRLIPNIEFLKSIGVKNMKDLFISCTPNLYKELMNRKISLS